MATPKKPLTHFHDCDVCLKTLTCCCKNPKQAIICMDCEPDFTRAMQYMIRKAGQSERLQ